MRSQLREQSGHIEALYAMLGHAVTVAPPGGQRGAPGAGLVFPDDTVTGFGGDWSAQFTPLWTVELAHPVTAAGFFNGFQDNGVPRVALAATINGTVLAFMRSSGQEILNFSTGHAGMIKSISTGLREGPARARGATERP